MRATCLICVCVLLVITLSCGQQTWDAAMQAGEAALQRGQYQEAEQIFSAAVHKAEEFGRHDRRVAVTLARLAQTYSAQAKFVEAEPVYLEALKIYQDVYGENHLDVAAMLNNLGVLHRKHGQYADAQRLLTRALAIKEQLLGPDHLEVGLGAEQLGCDASGSRRLGPGRDIVGARVSSARETLEPRPSGSAEESRRLCRRASQAQSKVLRQPLEGRANAIREKARS